MQDTGDKEQTEGLNKPQEMVSPEVDLKILEELGVSPEEAADHFRQTQQKKAQVASEQETRRVQTEEAIAQERARKEAAKREEWLRTGTGLYTEMFINPDQHYVAVYVGGTNYRIEHNKRHLVPQTLKEKHEKTKQQYPAKDASSERRYQEWDQAIPVITEGFGKEAITQMQFSPSDPEHWKTVVNAFDLITEGGIRKSEEAMTALKNLVKDDVKLAVTVQEAIKEKEITRVKATPAQSV